MRRYGRRFSPALKDGARSPMRLVAYLEHGVLLELGTPEQVFNSPRHESTRTFLERVR